MLRAYAELAEASSEASRIPGMSNTFGILPHSTSLRAEDSAQNLS